MLKHIIIALTLVIMSSCSDWLDVNENPNALTEVPSGELLLKGTLLANTQIHKGHLLRSSMYYTGGLIGLQLVQNTIYIYNFTPGDANSNWTHLYNGILVQNNKIKEISPDLDALEGIIDINAAMALGTATTIWGDIPYTEAIPDNPGLTVKPAYDNQVDVYSDVQDLLDKGITTLQNAATSLSGDGKDADIFYGGDLALWIEAAHTLKARNYLLTKDYAAALTEVVNGISDPANTMAYRPIGSVSGNSNVIFNLVESSRAGDMTANGTFFQDLLDPANANGRNHAKTDETARRNFMYISGDGGSADGIDAADAVMPLVSYEENLLIWAECLVRTGDNLGAIAKLNELRAHLRSGNAFNVVNGGDTFLYDDFVLADFQAAGIENVDAIAEDRAILREIIEERYVSGYTSYMPFNDMRRLKKSDADVIVPFPLNTATATANVERLLYPRSEIDTNPNVPSPLPDIFTVTTVNQ